MNRVQIEEAVHSGKPFTIRMADGKEFVVPTQDHILIAPNGTFVQLVSDDSRVATLALRTMTSVEFTPAPSA